MTQYDTIIVGNTANNSSVPTTTQYYSTKTFRTEKHYKAIKASPYDRTHGLKTTFNAGQLIPVYVDEALPGDTFSCNMTAFSRLATPIHPTMDNAFMDSHFFANKPVAVQDISKL